jgi:hypothetical protein
MVQGRASRRCHKRAPSVTTLCKCWQLLGGTDNLLSVLQSNTKVWRGSCTPEDLLSLRDPDNKLSGPPRLRFASNCIMLVRMGIWLRSKEFFEEQGPPSLRRGARRTTKTTRRVTETLRPCYVPTFSRFGLSPSPAADSRIQCCSLSTSARTVRAPANRVPASKTDIMGSA